MFQYMRERKKYGNIFPRSVAYQIDKNKLFQRNICSHYKTVKIIDISKNYPYEQTNDSRIKIKEVVLADGVIAVLINSGISRAYDIVTGKHICEINPHNNSVVHTLVYNTFNNTLIVAYAALPAHLQCKIIDCQKLKMGITNSSELGKEFEKVILTHPAFFEFCETNGRIGAANLNAHTYTFWDMETYKPVFEIVEEFQEIRVSDGLVAMFKQPIRNNIPLALFDIENGKKLVDTVIQILPSREMQFLELLVSKLLIKQEGCSLRIYDLLKKTRQKVKDTLTFEPSAFIFYDRPSPVNGKVYKNEISKRFFTISKDLIEFWDLDSNHLRKMYSIKVSGLRDADLCNHSLQSQLLCVYSTNGSEHLKEHSRLKHIDYIYEKAESQKPLHLENNIYNETNRMLNKTCELKRTKITRKNISTNIKHCTYKQNVLNSINTTTNMNNNNNNISNNIDNNNINSENIHSGLNKNMNMNFGALLFFSLTDGEFLNYISENVCGKVDVLASNSTMTSIVCGDSNGVLRILRNNPKYDEFEIRNAEVFSEASTDFSENNIYEDDIYEDEIIEPRSIESWNKMRKIVTERKKTCF